MAARGASESIEVQRGEVGEWMGLEVAPKIVDGIKVGRVRGKEGEVKGADAMAVVVNTDRPMSLETIPENQDRCAQMSFEVAQELDDLGSGDVGVGIKTEQAPHAIAAGADTQGGDRRDLAMRGGALTQHRVWPRGAQLRRRSGAMSRPDSSMNTELAFKRADFFLRAASPLSPSAG